MLPANKTQAYLNLLKNQEQMSQGVNGGNHARGPKRQSGN